MTQHPGGNCNAPACARLLDAFPTLAACEWCCKAVMLYSSHLCKVAMSTHAPIVNPSTSPYSNLKGVTE